VDKNIPFVDRNVYKLKMLWSFMYESRILKLKEVPVFSLADVSQIVSGKEYAKKLVRKMVLSKEIVRIKKDVYSFYEDPLLVSTFLAKPSYISSVSALSYHKLITQIPKDVFCFTLKKTKSFNFVSKINFVHTNSFFGFINLDYLNFEIPIAKPEKAIIDSIGLVPISIIEEAVSKIDRDRMIDYLKRIDKSAVIKRIGYLLERNGIEIYDAFKKKINDRYIYLDPLAKKRGKKNKKWGLIINDN